MNMTDYSCPHCGEAISNNEIGRHFGSIGGKIGGKATSDRKKRACRKNGKLGGRPKGYSPKTKAIPLVPAEPEQKNWDGS